MLEAYFNHLGQLQDADWEKVERKYSKRAKFTRFAEAGGLKPKMDERPYSSLTRLFVFRDSMAHIRSFGVDAIEDVEILDVVAQEVDGSELRRVTQASYGIFAGQPTAWAVLRFSPHRAQWVAGEQWHPEQLATFEADGSYLLKVPYSDNRELLGDILRFGADVQVLEPKELRAKVQKTLLEAAGKYI
jgi:hypothetical protein